MGATNTTANYSLSQFIGTDKPAWLQDYNGDMLKIDTGINAAKVAADGAQNAASAAQNDATTANNAITNTINPAISSLNTTVGNQGGAINTINSLIGNGTPTTTDQTIIGAINEINANVQKMGLQIKKTIAANTYSDYATALAEIRTAYNSLTNAEQYSAVLRIGSRILHVMGDAGLFSSLTADTTGIVVAFASNNQFLVNVYGTITNKSSQAQDDEIVLYYLEEV